jgi:DNA-binding transcriptional MocR family regulator
LDLAVDPSVLTSTEPAGIAPLRHAIAQRITAEGLPTTAEQVLVTAGAQQGIVLVAQLLVKPGDAVITEAVTWPGLADTIRRLGGRVVGVPMDAHGVIVDELVAAIERFRPAFIGLNPHHQNPTGTRLSSERRQAVADAAADYCVPLVEDRVAASIAFDGFVPPPMAARRPLAPGIVLDSINKAAWSGLRIGWVRADSQSINDLRSSRALADLFSPIPSQLMALAALGDLDAILRDRVAQLSQRATVLQDELAQHLPDWELDPVRGGMVCWARLPAGSATAFSRVAARYGVAIAGGREFSSSSVIDDHVRLPFTAPEPLLREAVGRLAAAWRRFRTETAEAAEAAEPPALAAIV